MAATYVDLRYELQLDGGPALIYGEQAGVIGSDVPWLECPACNALTWVITVTE